jgi:hypothetical protein
MPSSSSQKFIVPTRLPHGVDCVTLVIATVQRAAWLPILQFEQLISTSQRVEHSLSRAASTAFSGTNMIALSSFSPAGHVMQPATRLKCMLLHEHLQHQNISDVELAF